MMGLVSYPPPLRWIHPNPQGAYVPTNPPTTVDITSTVVAKGPITVCLIYTPTNDGTVPDLLHFVANGEVLGVFFVKLVHS